MSKFEEYKELIFQATENTDKFIYQAFLDSKNSNVKIIPQSIKSTYDLMQISDNSKDMVELKTRWKYTYEQFDDISINLWKVRRLLELQQDAGANNIYFCIFYPKSDKVILIDITHLEYDESDIITRKTTFETIADKNPKMMMNQMIALDIKNKVDNHKKTRTYKYTFPNLKEQYISTFLSYCKGYGIPQDVVDITLAQMS